MSSTHDLLSPAPVQAGWAMHPAPALLNGEGTPAPTGTEKIVFKVRERPEAPAQSAALVPRELKQSLLEAMDRLEGMLGQDGPLTAAPLPPRSAPVVQVPGPVQANSADPGVAETPAPRIRPVLGQLLGVLGAMAVLGCGVAWKVGEGGHRAEPMLRYTLQREPQRSPVIQAYVERANAGDVVAMRMLATCYQEGLEVTKDDHEASRWAAQAAIHGQLGPQILVSRLP